MVNTYALNPDIALGHNSVNVFLVLHYLFSLKLHCIIIKNQDFFIIILQYCAGIVNFYVTYPL